jgi:hypothetical protein
MLNIHPEGLINERQRELLAEADRQRLIAQLPVQQSAWRRELAAVCYRLATWLDEPAGYVQLPDPGPEDWVSPLLGV